MAPIFCILPKLSSRTPTSETWSPSITTVTCPAMTCKTSLWRPNVGTTQNRLSHSSLLTRPLFSIQLHTTPAWRIMVEKSTRWEYLVLIKKMTGTKLKRTLRVIVRCLKRVCTNPRDLMCPIWRWRSKPLTPNQKRLLPNIQYTTNLSSTRSPLLSWLCQIKLSPSLGDLNQEKVLKIIRSHLSCPTKK